MRTVPALMTVATVVLAACSPMMQGGAPDGTAKIKTKLIMVSVANGQIELFPDPVLVGAGNGVVKWIFDSNEPDYKFPEDAVTFPEPPVAPPSTAGCLRVANAASAAQRFNNCKPKQHDTEFHCNSVGQAPPAGTCYYYALKVEPKAGGAAIVKDPWAKNQ
jgi:hypothetical protein